MAEKKSKHVDIKTKPTSDSVEQYLNGLSTEQKRNDAFTLIDLMKKVTGEEPQLWSNSIVGFGNVVFKSPKTGREVDWMRVGFAPRKATFSLYLTMQINKYEQLLQKLGKHKTGVGCLYINKLEDIDMKVLEEIIQLSLKEGNSFSN